jgi:GAF domain-containing protein
MNVVPPMPSNEIDRLLKLSEFDVDYADMQDALKDLTKLAAKVAGTSISLINLVDVFTQWTISNFGLPLEQMAREDSVCQYTIMAKENFEVKNLTGDGRFSDKFYVTGGPKVTYYFGVPLQTTDGYNIGALCVLDQVGKEITPEKAELLKIIADEIVNRLFLTRHCDTCVHG